MKTYYVSIPIAGRLVFKVEADNKVDAKDKAWEKHDESGERDAECVEWEAMSHIIEGNICHVPYNSIEVQEVKNGA
jgi:hypothetical protein